jgi:FAD/FMN-containing dehydrogenase/Fe-S oxidoreductase
MTPTQQLATLAAANCEVAFDNLTRQLYATDASIYQIEPVAVAFPRDGRQASAIVQAAAAAGLSVTPRGAGTGLVGGALGDGVVADFARHNNRIGKFDLEARTVQVGPGVVLDQLNAFLKPFGLCFGPDVATSSRATLGGMIANNSSGMHAPVYGTTAEHIAALEVVLSDGRVRRVGPGEDHLRAQRELVEDLVQLNSLQIQERMPEGLTKRWPGYGLDRFLRDPGNLNQILCGSEGTLAGIVSAELKVVPLPADKGLGLIFFESVADAMQATVELLDLQPAAIEHIDRVLLDQTRGQLAFQAARDLLELDARPCEALLVVEFFEDVADKLAVLELRRLGSRRRILTVPAEMNRVWALRKAGLSLLTGCAGNAKPVTGIEDTAVRPRQLPEYVAALQGVMRKLGLEASYYGHAASGLLHVRPVLDLHRAEDVRRFRQVAEEVSALVLHFKGSLAAEHGVGIARTEFMRQQLGEELLTAMREIKHSFDPHNLFNPGKIIPDEQFEFDTHLRLGANYELKLPFEPVLAFAAKDGSFVSNLEQCNGCGGCRKLTPTMCPTFLVTGEEIMSTRGRANAIRAALELRGVEGGDPLRATELEAALSNCLSCKACTAECPSNVNLALLKAELLHARWRRDGLSFQARLFSAVDALGRLGTKFPGLANAMLEWGWMRGLLEATLGISAQRELPAYTHHRFDHWFATHAAASFKPHRGPVILWDDTFVRYHEPAIGMAAVHVLEVAGFEVRLAVGRECCGRPAFSQGNLAEARRSGRHNLELLAGGDQGAPIIFLEPSCYSMFVEDYRELNLPEAERIAGRCFLFEQFIENLLEREPHALWFNQSPGNVLIHAHCHAKALTDTSCMTRLATRLPERKVTMLDSGCCGMAGAFGALESKYELSLKIAEPLLEQIRHQPFGTIVVASGTSCRQQITHQVAVRTWHMAQLLADALQK